MAELTSAVRNPRQYLHSRWIDFMTLGGGSLIVLAALAVFYPRTEDARVALFALTVFLAHFVNHPHFAYSYQIFYRNFSTKVLSPESPLRTRYLLAGVGVPAALVAFFAVAIAKDSAALLGFAANVMFFTVGWHYAKQGFGILMVDAAHSQTRFNASERKRLIWNTHLAWVTFWLAANDALAAHDYWGLTYLMFDTPDTILAALLAAVAVSTLVVARDLALACLREGSFPMNGLIAYFVSIYVWLPVGMYEPLLALVSPLFHSLQYTSVVWRYQLNVEADKRCGRSVGAALRYRALFTARAALLRFLICGGLLGALGFWWAPQFLDAHSGYDQAVFGTTAFLFMGWTFINIHHYFLDNVIWRRENAETRRHLFSVGGH